MLDEFVVASIQLLEASKLAFCNAVVVWGIVDCTLILHWQIYFVIGSFFNHIFRLIKLYYVPNHEYLGVYIFIKKKKGKERKEYLWILQDGLHATCSKKTVSYWGCGRKALWWKSALSIKKSHLNKFSIVSWHMKMVSSLLSGKNRFLL